MPSERAPSPAAPGEAPRSSYSLVGMLVDPASPLRQRLLFTRRRASAVARIFYHSRMGMLGLFILLFFVGLAALAPWIAPYDPQWKSPIVGDQLLPPSLEKTAQNNTFILGTDHVGRDVLSRIIWGTWLTLVVGFAATVVSMGIGALVGLFAGYQGKAIDEVLMRLTDLFLVIPFLVLALVLGTVLPRNFGYTIWGIIFVIGITGWASTSRLIRAQTLSLKERMFVERARAIGSSNQHVIWRYMWPNVFPLVFAEAILTIAVSILSASALYFVRLGNPREVSWGRILQEAWDNGALTNGLYVWMLLPGICIILVVLAFTFLGYALDEILNPRLRKR